MKLLQGAYRREGLVKSGTLAKYVEAIIAVEENQAGEMCHEAFALPGLFAKSVPETARFSDIVVSESPNDSSHFRLACGQFKGDYIVLRSYLCVPSAEAERWHIPTTILQDEKFLEKAMLCYP